MSQMYEDDFGLAAAVALHRHIVEAAGDSDMDMQLTQRMIARGRDMGDAETQAVGWSCFAKKLLQHPVARPPLQLETGEAALRLRQTATFRRVWACLARAQRATHMGLGAIDGASVESSAVRGAPAHFRALGAQNARGTGSLIHSVQVRVGLILVVGNVTRAAGSCVGGSGLSATCCSPPSSGVTASAVCSSSRRRSLCLHACCPSISPHACLRWPASLDFKCASLLPGNGADVEQMRAVAHEPFL